MRKDIGACPTTSVKRLAKVALDTEASAASEATVHPRTGSCWIARTAGPATGSSSASHHRGAASAPAKCLEEDEVEHPVEDDGLPRGVGVELPEQQSREG